MRRAVLFVVGLLAVLAGLSSLHAQEGESAGLVIVPAEGAAQTYCVDVDADATGWDLLVDAGLAVNSEPSAMGQSVCSINGVGCKSPQESCFCQCQGSPCVYWSFWTQNDAGAWVYSNQGASGARALPGAVQGWVWGDGTTGKAPPPPALSFADVCAADVGLVEGDLVVSAPVDSTSVVSTSVDSTSVDSTSVVSAPVVTTPDTESLEDQNTESPAATWTFLLVLLPVPIILGLYLWRRK